jgi:hypothetical protein
MLAPGSTYTSAGRLNATLTVAPTVSYIAQGIAYDAAGNVLLDSAAVAGNNSYAGFARNATGAIYGTTTVSASDQISEGLRVSTSGQLVVVQGNPVVVENGNPLSTNGELCIA